MKMGAIKDDGRKPNFEASFGGFVVAHCKAVMGLVVVTNCLVGKGFPNDSMPHVDLSQLEYEKAKLQELYSY